MKSLLNISLSMILLISCKTPLIEERVDSLISELSWRSFEIKTNYGTSIRIIDQNAIAVEEYGKGISLKLIRALQDSEKTVIAHLILTKIWDPTVYQLNERYPEDNSNNDELNYIEYLVNNLYWYKFINDNDRLSIDEAEKQKIYNYWKNRINGCVGN